MSNTKFRVDERIFMLDCGRKYFTPKWIKKLIDELSGLGFNAINIHFAENMGIRLESKRFPWLAGGDHLLCGFGAQFGPPEDNDKYKCRECRMFFWSPKEPKTDKIKSCEKCIFQ